MTGFYVRTFRDGRWQNLEIDELTDDELGDLQDRDPGRGWAWAKALAKWIRENVREEANKP